MEILSPKDLDNQCPVTIDRWVDLDSEAHHMLDDNPSLTIKWYKLLVNDYIVTDTNGRLWCKGKDSETWHPYHFQNGTKLYGLRISKLAAN